MAQASILKFHTCLFQGTVQEAARSWDSIWGGGTGTSFFGFLCDARRYMAHGFWFGLVFCLSFGLVLVATVCLTSYFYLLYFFFICFFVYLVECLICLILSGKLLMLCFIALGFAVHGFDSCSFFQNVDSHVCAGHVLPC